MTPDVIQPAGEKTITLMKLLELQKHLHSGVTEWSAFPHKQYAVQRVQSQLQPAADKFDVVWWCLILLIWPILIHMEYHYHSIK